MRTVSNMSTDEVLKDNDNTQTEEDMNGDDKDLDDLKDDDEESSDEDDEEGESEDDDDEETDDEDADNDGIDNAEVDGEGVSEEDETDEEDDDDSDDGEEDEEIDEQEEELEAGDISSGDENCDRCPICLNRLGKQDIGTPESCDHCFCLECIQEWAKNVNTCPVDRQVFRIILARHPGEEKIFKQFPVEDHQQENEEEEEEDPTYCEVCGQSDREDRLLLCDRCDLGYHCDCLDPPLASVPVHEWFCPDCQQSRNTVDSESHLTGRQIARTRVSERVRRLIAEARAERAERRRRVTAMIAAQDALEGEELMPGPSTSRTTVSTAATAKKKTTPRKRKTTRRKTTRRKTRKRKTKKKTAGKKTKTRRKRKTKGKGKRKLKRKTKKPASSPSLARTAIFRAVTSVKGRIADKLGLSKPPPGRSLPMQKSATRQEGMARSSLDHGAATFSILGSKDELYLFADQEGEERQPVNRPAIPAETLLSRSAKSSHKPLSFISTKKQIVVKEAPTAPSVPTPVTGGFDLLGSILQNQDLLHKGSKHVTINRDGSLSATHISSAVASSARTTSPVKTTTEGISSSVRTTSPVKTTAEGISSSARTTSPVKTTAEGISSSTLSSQLSSTVAKDSKFAQRSSAHTSEDKSVEHTSPFKLRLSNTDSFSSSSTSGLETVEKSKTGNDVHQTKLSCSSQRLYPSQSDFTTEPSHFSETSSSDDESQAANAIYDLLVPVKQEKLDNGDDSLIWNKANTGLSIVKSTSSSLDSSYVEGIQTVTAAKSEYEAAISTVVNLDYGINHDTDYDKDAFYSNRSQNTGLSNGIKSEISFVDTTLAEQESKPIPGSESSSSGIDRSLSVNNSPEIGSGDSVLTTNINGSPRPHTVDVNSAVDLEADAVFSNNARLNAEEDVANNSIGFSTATSSQANLRNFAAVAGNLNNVYDDSSVGVMKRNFDLLVSTSSNLAGYESGEENDNIERYMHHPIDREEGEASDSNEEGEVREFEDRQRIDDQEEGEIVEEEERDRWDVSRNRCNDDHEDSGGLDVNAIHIEEMEIGTFRKRSMSQNEDNNNDGCKKMKKDEATQDSEIKQENKSEEEGSVSEDDTNSVKPVSRSFMLSNLLTSLKANETDRKQETTENKEEEEQKKQEEKEEEKEDLAKKPISILDFIGDASAKKFGLQTEQRDQGRLDQNFGQPRGSYSFGGGNNFGHRRSRQNNNRGRNRMQRDRGDGDAEDGCEEMGNAPMRPYDRRRGSWQEEDRGRQRSGSRDSQAVNSKSGLNEMKLHHDRDAETGRGRRDGESRYRSWRSRSSSGSPKRRAEKRRKSKDHEEKNRHSRRVRKSRWNNEEEEQNENVEENVEKQEEEIEQKNDSSALPATQANGYSPAVITDRHPLATGPYQSQQYPIGIASYSYPGAPVPNLPCSQPPPHSHPHTHPHAPHSGPHFSHSASLNQSPYSHIPSRPPHPDAKQQHHHGYPTSYYPQPHHASVVQKAPPPPPHPYPHAVYTGHYPPQSGQSASTLAHPNPHMAAASQHHSGYPRYPPAITHQYAHSAPHAAYPPRPVAPGLASPAVYSLATSAASGYPPQQHLSASNTPTIPRYTNTTLAVKQEPSIPHTVAAVKQESSTSATRRPLPTHPETKRQRETIKESSPNDVKPARASYRISPPTSTIKGVTTYDKVDSSILLNEVKKGFRQLVEDAVRSALKGAWSSKKITKEEYKDIFKRAVEKVCGSKETVVNQEKIQSLVNAYVIKARRTRKAMPT